MFGYPDVLKEPAADVLASFRASQFAVIAGFLGLALGAAMLAPVAVGVGRLSDSRVMRWAVPVGVAAAVVQVVGLLRWPLLVPGWAATDAGADPAAAAAARESFGTANRILGNLVGETGGYLLTAAWTLLVLAALGTAFAGRWFVALGAVSAVLVLAGVLSPLDLPVVDTGQLRRLRPVERLARDLRGRAAGARAPRDRVPCRRGRRRDRRRERERGPMTAARTTGRRWSARGPSGRSASWPSRSPASRAGWSRARSTTSSRPCSGER